MNAYISGLSLQTLMELLKTCIDTREHNFPNDLYVMYFILGWIYSENIEHERNPSSSSGEIVAHAAKQHVQIHLRIPWAFISVKILK